MTRSGAYVRATLATCNVRHFVRFDGLLMEDWMAGQ